MTLALQLVVLAQAAVAQPPQVQVTPSPQILLQKPRCAAEEPADVVVCGRARRSYRIDSDVLQAERATNAVPDRLQIRDPDQYAQCVGAMCGGDFIPLVAIAEKLVIAGVDAASGNDWRQDFRTHPDEYAAYRDAKRRSGKVSFSVSAGTSR